MILALAVPSARGYFHYFLRKWARMGKKKPAGIRSVRDALLRIQELAGQEAVYLAVIARLDAHVIDDTGERLREPLEDRFGRDVPDVLVDQVIADMRTRCREIDTELAALTG